MPSKISPSSATPPPLGTLIDDDALELVEVLGVGGYGVVYRAVDTRSSRHKSYAVKCLIRSHIQQSSRQRQVHIREITLHQLASAHPNVVTLHRVIEEYQYTYIIMEYAGDGDLFTQILHSCRYLGKDHLIKHVFLQLLDAVEYCHSLGIYHRDLKPENVLCFDGGLRIAITDFGLATTDRISEELRTGSVYHMSPECLGGEFAPTGTYSPLANDIWSLAIILLNLATGRNPWKSASSSDPTFQAYLENPIGFLPTVLPISLEINAILTRMLELDWRQRMSLAEIRHAIENVDSFYSEAVIFEGSMARCPWEAGMDIESDGEQSAQGERVEQGDKEELKSCWSQDSDSEMVFATHSVGGDSSWAEYSTSAATWGCDEVESPPLSPEDTRAFETYRSPRTPPSTYSPLSPTGSESSPSMPVTPGAVNVVVFEDASQVFSAKSLTVNTNCGRYRYRDGSVETISTGSSAMHTAVESYGDWSSSFFLASSRSPSKASLPMPSSVDLAPPSAVGFDDMDMNGWEYSPDEPSESYPSARVRNSLHLELDEEPEPYSADNADSPDGHFWTEPRTSPEAHHSSHPFTIISSAPIPIPTKKTGEGRSRGPSIFNPIKFFPRSPPNSTLSRPIGSQPFDSLATHHTVSPATPSFPLPAQPAPFTLVMPTSTKDTSCRDTARLRTKRHWFSPAKFFAGTGAAS